MEGTRQRRSKRQQSTRDGHARAVVADLNQADRKRRRRLASRRSEGSPTRRPLWTLAQREIESLRNQLAAEQHGFWHFGRR